MVAIKSCLNDFGYNDTVCYNLDSEEYHDQNVEVSIELNHFNVYVTLITSIFPIFFSFYLGAWADLFGRKFLFYVVLIGEFIYLYLLKYKPGSILQDSSGLHLHVWAFLLAMLLVNLTA